jgi:hypothetical protein
METLTIGDTIKTITTHYIDGSFVVGPEGFEPSTNGL